MSGLDKDCFDCHRADGALMSVNEAVDHISRRVTALAGVEIQPLRACLGRILAEDQTSAIPVPAYDTSAMDGWAVFAGDLSPQGPTLLPVGGRVAAGHPLREPAQRGKAYRILGGAPLPAGLDAVLMEEHCRLEGAVVVLPGRPDAGANIRQAAQAVPAGALALTAGTRLRPQEIGVAATIGLTALPVRKPLRAALFSTGDAVRQPGQPLPEGCLYDANRFTLAALLDGMGCAVTDLGILPDDFETIRATLAEAAAGHDLIITAGEANHAKAAVQSLGSLHLWRLAVKPGEPLALGQIEGTPFLGLPGDPVAVMVTFLLFARPLITRLSGGVPLVPRRYSIPAAFRLTKTAGCREFLRARLVDSGFGLVVDLFRGDSSTVLASMTACDGLVELPEGDQSIAPGDPVEFLPFAEVIP